MGSLRANLAFGAELALWSPQGGLLRQEQGHGGEEKRRSMRPHTPRGPSSPRGSRRAATRFTIASATTTYHLNNVRLNHGMEGEVPPLFH
jgi:hypothetical protein